MSDWDSMKCLISVRSPKNTMQFLDL